MDAFVEVEEGEIVDAGENFAGVEGVVAVVGGGVWVGEEDEVVDPVAEFGGEVEEGEYALWFERVVIGGVVWVGRVG